MNVRKTAVMVCKPYHIVVRHSDAAYMLRMAGEGPLYRYHQRQRVRYPDCAAYLSAGSLEAHRNTQHSVSHRISWETHTPTAPST